MLARVLFIHLAVAAVYGIDTGSSKEKCLAKSPNDCSLEITFQDTFSIDCDSVVAENDRYRLMSKPSLNASGVLASSTPVLIVMFDPDAPISDTLGFMHWVAAGHVGDDGHVVVDKEYLAYYPPTPPKGDGLHRYQIFLFKAVPWPPALVTGRRDTDFCGFVKNTFGEFSQFFRYVQPIASFQFRFLRSV